MCGRAEPAPTFLIKMSQFLQKIKIGTRTSKLALAQTAEVKALLLQHCGIKEEQIEIVPITTSGDKIQDRNLAEIGGKGLFIKELEESLLSKKIDIAIHSAKDVPPFVHESTKIIAFTKRKDARDYFISKKFSSLSKLPNAAVVGTSSARRKAILLKLRPDLNIVNFRGNVDTRLAKVEDEKVDATILALCGLERLQKNITQENIIPLDVMLPSAGQGCLAIQLRQDDENLLAMATKLNDEQTQICVEVERKFLRELGASCKTPVSAYCEMKNDELNFRTIIFDFDGTKSFATDNSIKLANKEKDSADLATLAAKQTKEQAQDLLAKICCD